MDLVPPVAGPLPGGPARRDHRGPHPPDQRRRLRGARLAPALRGAARLPRQGAPGARPGDARPAQARGPGGGRLHGRRPRRASSRPENNAWVEVTLHEGKQHEVKRLLEAVGHPVSKLRRVAFGPVTTKGLEPGQFRALTPEEIAGLRKGEGGRAPAMRRVPRRRKHPAAPARPGGPTRGRRAPGAPRRRPRPAEPRAAGARRPARARGRGAVRVRAAAGRPGEDGGERDEAAVVRLPAAPRGARPVRAGQAHRRGAARAGPRRRGQARVEREPARPVAEGGRGGPRRGGRRQSLPRPAGDRAASGARRAARRAR